jgi:hypothetical protein
MSLMEYYGEQCDRRNPENVTVSATVSLVCVGGGDCSEGHRRGGFRGGLHFQLIRGIANDMKAFGLSGGRWIFRRVTPGALARTWVLPLLLGLASCMGSPGTLALQPAFEVMTPAGLASVSLRESPAGMTDAEFTQLVMVGTKWAAPDGVIAGRVEPPFPSQRIVWHVNLSPERGMSRLVVNVFDGANPYAFEQGTVMNDAPTAAVTSAVESMSKRLLADVAVREGVPNRLSGQVPQYEASQTNGPKC